MRRRLARFLFVTLLGTVATVLGVVTALVLTPPGRNLLARTVSAELSRVVNGSITIGSISGSFLYDLTIERLVVRDTAGALLADLPRVRVGYRLPNLLAGRFVLGRLHLDAPLIQLIRHPNGRMNYEDVLRLGQGPPGGPSPLIAFGDVRLRDGTLRLLLPWRPLEGLDTERQRDSALAAERAKPGRRIEPGPEGFQRVIEFQHLTGTLSRLRISTPDRQPFLVDIDTLATRITDPPVELRDAAGRVVFPGDSVIVSLRRGALPGTRFTGGGAVTFPHDTVLYDLQFVASQVNLADLRFISPDFPEFVGRATVAAHSESGTRTAYVVTDLQLARGRQRVQGELTALDDRRRGLGVRDLRLTLRELDLDAVRPYVPELPFEGTVTGSVRASGFFDAMDIDVVWDFADARVPGRPVTHVDAEGRVTLGGEEALVFDGVTVRDADVALATVRRLAPAVALEGRLAATGRLNGPMRNVTFVGTARHYHGDRPVSELNGLVRLDTRTDTLGLTTDVALQPLAFEGLRGSFPALRARGSLTGRVRLDGSLARLAVDASVSGEIGTIEAQGIATLLPPAWGADDLTVAFRRLDLAALSDTFPATSLNGALRLSGSADSARAPTGDLVLRLDDSRVAGFRVDSLAVRGGVRDSVFTVDTLEGRIAGVTLRGGGRLGWARPHEGRMAFTFAIDSLALFDSLLEAAAAMEPDTAVDAMPLAGQATGTLAIEGSLDSIAVTADGLGRALAWRRFRSPEARVTARWARASRASVGLAVTMDTLAYGDRLFRDLGLRLGGYTDSLAWGGAVTVGRDLTSRIAAAGDWWQRNGETAIQIDTLTARLAQHTWRLDAPATIALGGGARRTSSLVLSAVDGSGRLRVEGSVPGETPGALAVEAFGVHLRDLYGLLQRDTTGVRGAVGVSLDVRGSAAAPEIEGSAWLEDVVFGDFRAPFARVVLHYADRRLDAHAGIFRTGAEVLEIDARLPMNLAFEDVERRALDGPIAVRARADSADLALLEAVLPGVRDVEGDVVGEATVSGTWEDPQISGFANISRGAMTIPGIGVRYAAILARTEFSGDSVLIPYALVTSGQGTLQITGALHFDNLSNPVLNLALEANRFRALDIRDFLALTVTGNAQLTGPILKATATGSATVDEGVFYFADLVNKQVINLDDPTIADLVDTTLIRKEKLGAGFENRVLDSLTVRALKLEMGSGVFLRSTEANIQLAGDLVVNKVRNEYRPVGTLEAARGMYTLKLGFVNRDFAVNRGTVRYFGTPDLNAELNIEAEHVVRTRQGEELPVVAEITGTLQNPRLELRSTAGRQLSDADLVSYLVFGAPLSQATAIGEGAAVQQALSIISAGAASELERALISDLGVPIDYVEIRPEITAGAGTALGVAAGLRLGFGWRIGPKTFVTLNAGYCDPSAASTAVHFGASLEYRFSRAWRAQTSFEPARGYCAVPAFGLTTAHYQVGADVFWQREF